MEAVCSHSSVVWVSVIAEPWDQAAPTVDFFFFWYRAVGAGFPCSSAVPKLLVVFQGCFDNFCGEVHAWGLVHELQFASWGSTCKGLCPFLMLGMSRAAMPIRWDCSYQNIHAIKGNSTIWEMKARFCRHLSFLSTVQNSGRKRDSFNTIILVLIMACFFFLKNK